MDYQRNGKYFGETTQPLSLTPDDMAFHLEYTDPAFVARVLKMSYLAGNKLILTLKTKINVSFLGPCMQYVLGESFLLATSQNIDIYFH